MQNYARFSKLKITQEKEKLFSEAHEKFVESVPREIPKFLDTIHVQVRKKE